MTPEQFDRIMEQQLNICRDVLGSKADEYASDLDRLHNFKLAAALMEKTPTKALAGMMAKHTISLYDMMESGHPHPLELWSEKITDHINYLILLRAIVLENDMMLQDVLPYNP